MKKLLSVIIPAFNEEAMIEKTASTIHTILKEANIMHELLFIDDGSKDGTWQKIEEASNSLDVVNGVKFSRNFGKESAIYAGLCHSKGDCAVVIDCDLQHPPEKIVEMYKLWAEDGYEIVEAVKSSRGKESFLHKLSAKMFYGIISKVTKIDMARASDFKLLDRKAIDSLIELKESNAFFRALSSWIGYKTVRIEFEVQERTEGESKWSTRSLIKYAVRNISSFTTAPMQIITVLGFLILMVSVVFGCIAIVQKIIGTAVPGFTTVIILQLMSSSIIMISLGIIGFYIAKINEEVKNRPKYIVQKICQSKEQKIEDKTDEN